MRKILLLLMALLFLLNSFTLAMAVPEYRIKPGDVLDIEVWGFDEFKATDTMSATPSEIPKGAVIVRPDGKISFPLVGEVTVADLSPGELTGTLTTALSEYIKNPKITVNIVKYHTVRVYVLGEVNKPGLYEIDKQHNVLDAIGMAMGYTSNAAKKNVFIIPKDNTGAPIKVNLLNLLKKGDVSQNRTLNDGDVVYLTDNGKINFATDIAPLITTAYYVTRLNKD